MPIVIGNEPIGAIGQLATYAGQGRFNQQQTENAQRNAQLALQQQGQMLDYQQSINHLNAQFQMQAAQQANQRYMQQAEGEWGMARDQQRYAYDAYGNQLDREFRADESEQDRALREYQMDQEQFMATQKAMVESGDWTFDYSPKQKQRIAGYHDTLDKIKNDPTLSIPEKLVASRPVRQKLFQESPVMRPAEKGVPIAEYVRDNVFTDTDGTKYIRQPKGDIRPVQPKQQAEKPPFSQKDYDAAETSLLMKLPKGTPITGPMIVDEAMRRRTELDGLNARYGVSREQPPAQLQSVPTSSAGALAGQQLPSGIQQQQPAPQQQRQQLPPSGNVGFPTVRPTDLTPNPEPMQMSRYGDWMIQHAGENEQPMTGDQFVAANPGMRELLTKKNGQQEANLAYRQYRRTFDSVRQFGRPGFVPENERQAFSEATDSAFRYFRDGKMPPTGVLRKVKAAIKKWPAAFAPDLLEMFSNKMKESGDAAQPVRD